MWYETSTWVGLSFTLSSVLAIFLIRAVMGPVKEIEAADA